MILEGAELVGGSATGELLYSDTGISFWGGVDPTTGEVIDHAHPLFRESTSSKVLALPSGRGSCTGSQVVLELLLGGAAPAAILLRQPDAILALGVIVAEEMFGRSIPVVSLGEAGFEALGREPAAAMVQVRGARVLIDKDGGGNLAAPSTPEELLRASGLSLSDEEAAMLRGDRGAALAVAMRIVARAAAAQGARRLTAVAQAHIDGCTYIGPGGLKFAQELVKLGGRVSVPTTLNAISVDKRRWRELGVSPALGEPASALADAYMALGAEPTFTCAPYLLDSAPAKGDQVAWGESNAVTFVNSVLGARSQKYADYLDICAALTGRAPACGPHLDEGRRPTITLDASPLKRYMESGCDSFYPVLGYLAGLQAEARVPLVLGLEDSGATMDNLKAFSAAFGTSAGAPMFHIAGVTAEGRAGGLGGDRPPQENVLLREEAFADAYDSLDGKGEGSEVDLVALGNPHLSLTECADLAALCAPGFGPKSPNVDVIATMGRHIHKLATDKGYTQVMEEFGVRFVTDTCWCMLTEPVVPVASKRLITNSAKYAHYAPGLVDRRVRFSSLSGCMHAARTGLAPPRPAWLGSRGLHIIRRPAGHHLVVRGRVRRASLAASCTFSGVVLSAVCLLGGARWPYCTQRCACGSSPLPAGYGRW